MFSRRKKNAEEPQPNEEVQANDPGTDAPGEVPPEATEEDSLQEANIEPIYEEPLEEVGDSVLGESDTEPLTSEEEIALLRDKWLRAAAEVENTRKRAIREREVVRLRERHHLLQAFLPILDNLERAVTAQGGASNEWLEGIEAVVVQFQNLLAEYGVVEIDGAEGFDPAQHEAVATAHVPGQDPGTILEVVQTGYRLKDGPALRPAKVVVARAEEAS